MVGKGDGWIGPSKEGLFGRLIIFVDSFPMDMMAYPESHDLNVLVMANTNM